MEFGRRNRTHLTSLPRGEWHVFFISEEALVRDFRDRKRDYFTLGFSGHTTSAECTMCQRTIFLREEELVCKILDSRMVTTEIGPAKECVTTHLPEQPALTMRRVLQRRAHASLPHPKFFCRGYKIVLRRIWKTPNFLSDKLPDYFASRKYIGFVLIAL
ncbi:hypothetical protein TNCV_4401481 [Trichonephila clavipes]|nr:hypothetical protein TNCV_4401481 [Trichonephila clavipes]